MAEETELNSSTRLLEDDHHVHALVKELVPRLLTQDVSQRDILASLKPIVKELTFHDATYLIRHLGSDSHMRALVVKIFNNHLPKL